MKQEQERVERTTERDRPEKLEDQRGTILIDTHRTKTRLQLEWGIQGITSSCSLIPSILGFLIMQTWTSFGLFTSVCTHSDFIWVVYLRLHTLRLHLGCLPPFAHIQTSFGLFTSRGSFTSVCTLSDFIWVVYLRLHTLRLHLGRLPQFAHSQTSFGLFTSVCTHSDFIWVVYLRLHTLRLHLGCLPPFAHTVQTSFVLFTSVCTHSDFIWIPCTNLHFIWVVYLRLHTRLRLHLGCLPQFAHTRTSFGSLMQTWTWFGFPIY